MLYCAFTLHSINMMGLVGTCAFTLYLINMMKYVPTNPISNVSTNPGSTCHMFKLNVSNMAHNCTPI